MKKKFSLILLLIIFLPCMFFMSACGSKDNKFNIKFIVDGEVYSVVQTAGNEIITLPENPTKDGYEFDGWYFDNDVWEQPFTADSLLTIKLSEDTKICCKWKLIEYKANFYADGLLIGTSAFNVEDKTIANIPQVPEKLGYDGSWESYTIQANDLTINAIYKKKTFTIVWKNYDNSVLRTDKNIEYGAVPTYGEKLPSKIGNSQYSYEFIGWSPKITEVTENMEYIAQYSEKINTYQVIWKNYNGDILEIDNNVTFGVMPNYQGEEPCRAGDAQFSYKFSGWSPKVSTVEKDIVYTAQFNTITNKYAITWVNYDGTILENEYIEYGLMPNYQGEKPIKPNSAQFTYEFSGWTPQISVVTQSMTYTAQYNQIINQYTVTFKNYDETILSKVIVNYGSSATFTGNVPTRPDEEHYSYLFEGWDKNFTIITSNMDVIAQYTKYIKYEFIYSNSNVEIIKVKCGESVENYYPVNTPPTTIGMNRYYYEGWNSTDDFTYVENYRIVQLYSITYHLDRGTNSENNVVLLEQSSSFELNDAYKKGYIFNGWYTESSYANKVSKISNINADLNLYASFEVINYSIKYHLDGGTNSIKNPNSFSCEDVINLQYATKNGYTFIGWFDDLNYSNQVTILENYYKNIDLYAKWQANTYDVTLHSNEGVTSRTYTISLNNFYSSNEGFIIKNYEIESGSSFNPYAVCKSSCNINGTSYYLKGWYLDSEYQNFIDEQYIINSDINIFAKWETNTTSYTIWSLIEKEVEFNHYSESYSTQYYRVLSDIGVDVLFDIYYKIDRIDKASSYSSLNIYNITTQTTILDVSGSKIYPATSKSDKITVKAKQGDIICISMKRDNDLALDPYYKIRNISYQSFSVATSCSDTIEKVLFDSIPNFPNYTKLGYKFIGWLDKNNNLIDLTQKWTISSNTDLYAKWEAIDYTIEYILDNGTNASDNPNNYTIEDNIVLQNPTKTGYTFIGWYLDSNYSTKIETIVSMNVNLILYAKFIPNTYNLLLNDMDGYHEVKVEFISDNNVISTQFIGNLSHISYIEPENKNGYIFAGWYQEETFINLFDFSSSFSENVKLYAKWIKLDVNNIITTNMSCLDSVNINGKIMTIYAFVPKCSKDITFTSNGSIDSVGFLYDENMNLLTSNDDISYDDINFSITYTVQAGKLYYLGIKAKQTSVSGEININIIGMNNPVCSGNGMKYNEQTIKVTFDTVFELPTPTKSGYVFVGWFDSLDVQYHSSTWLYTNDLTLYAKWVLNEN